MTITTKKSMGRTGFASVIAIAGVAASLAAIAAETEIGAVTIKAKRATEQVVGRTSSGVPIKSYELGYRVSYTDLDLTTSSGKDKLRERVREAAKMACADLDKLYPLTPQDPSCAPKAADEAMSQVDAAIMAAH
jgi:UrcA family protein